jgi:pilus assembly protein CpaF
MLNYGPLKTLLLSDDMSEVMVNAWDHVFVEHKGVLVRTAARFIDQREFQDLVFAILTFDKHDYTKGYYFDGILPEGHRYNITLPPLSPRGPTLTIRKFLEKNFSLQQLTSSDFISEKTARFLKLAVECRLNIVVSGGTGTGKTSFLNCLASLIPEDQRVVSIEDTQELRPTHVNWVYLKTVKNDTAKLTARDCVFNALRMRPDRIVVGECRGPEAFDMLQAMNTGHEGSMTSIHANSAVDCLARLETLINVANPDMPVKMVRSQISEAVDIIVQLKRMPDGSRQVSEIMELTGMEGEIISRSPIFTRNKLGKLDVTGYVPDIIEKMNAVTKKISSQFFDPNTQLKKTS